ncbi:hypothetical protein [Enterococcus phage vB_EfKS5]|nr:hypothetical protein [Enterococcus phage vB_EfKS5]DAJ06226.1 MAG TPA: hypothetical protein [Caudoviricetes sp.]
MSAYSFHTSYRAVMLKGAQEEKNFTQTNLNARTGLN